MLAWRGAGAFTALGRQPHEARGDHLLGISDTSIGCSQVCTTGEQIIISAFAATLPPAFRLHHYCRTSSPPVLGDHINSIQVFRMRHLSTASPRWRKVSVTVKFCSSAFLFTNRYPSSLILTFSLSRLMERLLLERKDIQSLSHVQWSTIDLHD